MRDAIIGIVAGAALTGVGITAKDVVEDRSLWARGAVAITLFLAIDLLKETLGHLGYALIGVALVLGVLWAWMSLVADDDAAGEAA